jgi:hypothetical protein
MLIQTTTFFVTANSDSELNRIVTQTSRQMVVDQMNSCRDKYLPFGVDEKHLEKMVIFLFFSSCFQLSGILITNFKGLTFGLKPEYTT